MLKSLAYCGILLSGVGAIVLAMIHAQGDPDDIYGDVISLPPEIRPARKMAEGGSSEQSGRAVTDGSHSHEQRL
jgi:hypothetical protein